jgi:proliferating cell nuclear antigen
VGGETMFKLVIDDARKFKNSIDAIVNIIEEGQLEIGENGLFLRAIDPSQIAMVVFNMPKSAFSLYEVSIPPVKVGLNFEMISKILARARGSEKLEISKQENKVQLKFLGSKRNRSFKIPILDMAEGISREPQSFTDTVITVKSSAFKESLKDALLVDSNVTLRAKEKQFLIEVRGDSSELVEENEEDNDMLISIKSTEPAKATFSLQYLDDIVKACPDNMPLTLYLKTNKPLKVEYNVDEAKLVYYLAPRTTEE